MFKEILFGFCFTCFFSSLSGEQVSLELKNPRATKKSLCTDEGGTLTADELRVQAKEIHYYENNQGEKIVEAKGDLFIIYHKKFFLADSITYNISEQRGILRNANGFAEGLFFGGKEVTLNPDGSLDAASAFVTTSDTELPEWSVRSDNIHMDERYQVRAEKPTLNVGQSPVLWLPSYTLGINQRFKPKESRLKFHTRWEAKQGPLLLARFRAWDSEELKIHLRGEYRIKRGGGGAVELDYIPDHKRQNLQMRNFYAYDTFYNDNNPNKLRSRYRLQGIYSGKSIDKKWELFARWDALSDKNMRSDFPTQLFELSTLERTEGYVKAYYDSVFSSLYGRPRINPFRGFKQELPTLTVTPKPLSLGKTGAVFDNAFRLAYLEYSYADNLEHLVPNFRSSRLETKQQIYRPFHFSGVTLTPQAGFRGIFYSNNPQHQAIGQAIAHYGLDAQTSFGKNYTQFQHTLTPYASFSGYTKPTAPPGQVYIFSLQDGWNSLNQLKVGLRQLFFSQAHFSPKPTFSTDLYAYNFFDAPTLTAPFPKLGWTTTTHLSTMMLGTYCGYNLQVNALDFANVLLGMTINDYLAFTAEVRHRGPYYWRKNDYDNYLLDVTRPIDALATSPLSDLRTTFRCKWQLQLAPLWTLRVLNHVGWRPNKPFYHESKVEVQTYLSNTWKLRCTYTRTVRDNQFSFAVSLM